MSANKIFYTVLAFVFFIPAVVFSQANNHEIFGKGDNDITLGIGLDGHYSYNTSSGYNQTLSYTLGYEYCAIDPVGKCGAIGFGAYLTYFTSNLSWTDGYNYSDKYNFEFLTARASYHYHIRYSAKVDPYAGISIGYVLAQHNFSTNDPNINSQGSPGYAADHYGGVSPLAYGGFLGIRYFFAQQFGIFGELVIFNQGYNYVGLGLTWKF
jgi:hypothetical protein